MRTSRRRWKRDSETEKGRGMERQRRGKGKNTKMNFEREVLLNVDTKTDKGGGVHIRLDTGQTYNDGLFLVTFRLSPCSTPTKTTLNVTPTARALRHRPEIRLSSLTMAAVMVFVPLCVCGIRFSCDKVVHEECGNRSCDMILRLSHRRCHFEGHCVDGSTELLSDGDIRCL